nr:gdsl esterase/lipase [Quercus suber]
MSSPRVIMLTLTIVLVVTVAPNKAEAARAFFVFGDSLVDSGNNNYLATTARADYPPNGIDYPTHRPTGRFSNGFNLPDIISEQMGAEHTLPYLSPQLTGQKLLVGANFASAGIGILNDTGIQFGRGGEELSTELSVALQRSLLGGKSGAGAGIDLSSLVVVEGKICWDLYIDCLVVCSDGNLLDALGAAIKAALSNTGIPRVQVAAGASGDEQPEVDISDEEFLQFDTSDIPVIVTLTKVGRHYIVDATTEEESQMSSAISISVNRKGHICGLNKRGGAGLDPSIVLDMISVAKHVSEQLMNKLDSEIAAAEAGEDES